MKTKYLHLRRKIDDRIQSTGGMTIAYIIDDDFKVIGFAPARCHKNDTYNKQQGRVKAEGRLKSDNYFVQVHLQDEAQFIQECHTMYTKICQEDTRQ